MPTYDQMLERFHDTYALNDPAMDETHREFLLLCQRTALSPGPDFLANFEHLRHHTQDHFAAEEARMAACTYPLLAEHRSDHQRILGDMNRFTQRIHAGRTMMARAWLNETLSSWFDLHAKTMDSALAAHLRTQP